MEVSVCPNCKKTICPVPEKPKDGQEFAVVDSKRIWYDDEVEKYKLRCKDVEHSQKYGITEKHFEEELKFLQELKPHTFVCPLREQQVIDSIKKNKCLIECHDTMGEYVKCVNYTLRGMKYFERL